MEDSLKSAPFTQHQQSDLEAASEAIYSTAADDVVESFDNRTLGRDLLALVTIFLIVVTYHIQNPLLQFELQFGRAFRNASLQSVLTVVLVIVAFVLIRTTLRKNDTTVSAFAKRATTHYFGATTPTFAGVCAGAGVVLCICGGCNCVPMERTRRAL